LIKEKAYSEKRKAQNAKP